MRHNREDYAKLRPCEEIEQHEWAKLERARRTIDPRKLAALTPGWLKAHLRAGLPPARAVFDMRTYVPFAGTRQAADTRKASDFPQWDEDSMTIAEYVRQCEAVWTLTHVPNYCDGRPEYRDHNGIREMPEVGDMVTA